MLDKLLNMKPFQVQPNQRSQFKSLSPTQPQYSYQPEQQFLR